MSLENKQMIDIDQIRAGRSELLGRTTELANDFLDGVVDRPVARPVEFDKLLAEMRAEGLPIEGDDPKQIIEQLANLAGRAVVATAGPRYFGFVVGGSLPVTVAADWLTSVWDQNAAFYAHSPLAAAAEQISAEWLIELLTGEGNECRQRWWRHDGQLYGAGNRPPCFARKAWLDVGRQVCLVRRQ
jgi:hypothetical protein